MTDTSSDPFAGVGESLPSRAKPPRRAVWRSTAGAALLLIGGAVKAAAVFWVVAEE
jgi:hypothetical protein